VKNVQIRYTEKKEETLEKGKNNEENTDN